MSVNRGCSSNDFCLESVVDGSNIEFTVLSSKSGWAAFGIGNNMIDADIYVGWLNSLGNPVVSRRIATDYDLPLTNPVVNFNASVGQKSQSWAKLAFKVRRPIVSGNTITNTSAFVYAHSDQGPSNPNDPNSPFPYHGLARGNLPLTNFLGNGDSQVAAEDNYKTILLAHGVLFFLAWGMAPFVGIFVARYLKNIMGVWWYRVHVMCFLIVTGLLSLISFIIIVKNTDPPHFNGTHQKIGLAIFVMMFIQFALGFVSNALWTPTRTSIPWWDMVHWYFGRCLVLLGIINIFLGMLQYSELSGDPILGLKIVYWVWIGLAFGVMIFGQFYFGVHHHVQQEDESKAREESTQE